MQDCACQQMCGCVPARVQRGLRGCVLVQGVRPVSGEDRGQP